MLKEKLLKAIQSHNTPQTAGLSPLILMALTAMSEEDVKGLLLWLRAWVNDILPEGS